MMGEGFQIQVTAALRLFDSFTGRRAEEGTVRLIPREEALGGLASGSELRVIKKGDGLLVLTGQGTPESVTLESPLYRTAVLSKESLGSVEEPGRIWLEPGGAYVYPPHTGWARARLAPGQQVLALPLGGGEMKLTGDGKAGEETLSVYDSLGAALEGRPAALWDDGKKPELVRVRELQREQGTCILWAPLKAGHKKVKTSLSPVYPGRADENGALGIGIPGKAGSGCPCLLLDEAGKVIEEVILN